MTTVELLQIMWGARDHPEVTGDAFLLWSKINSLRLNRAADAGRLPDRFECSIEMLVSVPTGWPLERVFTAARDLEEQGIIKVWSDNAVGG